jgi:hypothetical protein
VKNHTHTIPINRRVWLIREIDEQGVEYRLTPKQYFKYKQLEEWNKRDILLGIAQLG